MFSLISGYKIPCMHCTVHKLQFFFQENSSTQHLCSCIQDYVGDPYTACGPECVEDSNCAYILACLGGKCRDPCPGSCGRQAECRVINHVPSCYCPEGYTGNPLSSCREIIEPREFFPNFGLMCNICDMSGN